MSDNGEAKVSEKELVREIMRLMADGKARTPAMVTEHTKEDRRRVCIVLGRLVNFGLLELSPIKCKLCGTESTAYRTPTPTKAA